MTIIELIDRLERVRKMGETNWAARCPAHDDRVQSLSVGLGADDRILICCHAGCSCDDVVSVLGLNVGDLFVERRDVPARFTHRAGFLHVPALARARATMQRRDPPAPVITDDDVVRWALRLQGHELLLARIRSVKGWTAATLLIHSIGWDGRRFTLPVRASGGQLRGVLRYLPGGEPKMLATRGVGRDLWPAPEMLAMDEPLWLVEGEPDALSATELGLQAVSVPGAARWDDDWTRRLADRQVIVVADCDRPGRTAAQRAMNQLYRHADVRYVDLDATRCDGHDLGDELAAAIPQGELGVRRLRRALEDAAGLRQEGRAA